jgi:hypothetical protein
MRKPETANGNVVLNARPVARENKLGYSRRIVSLSVV